MTSINSLLVLSLTEHIWNEEGASVELENSTGNLKYENAKWISFDEVIGEKYIENHNWKIKIYMKNAKYDNFMNTSTSTHIKRLISFINNDPYFKFNYLKIDKNDNIITDNEDKGQSIKCSFECPICLDTKQKGVKLHCNHLFCKKCLVRWLKKTKNCPYCRQTTYI